MNGSLFSFPRFWAVVVKEFLQLRRDRMTFAMIVAIPLMQTILFGYAINNDPRHLPTAVVCSDDSPLARSLEASLVNSGYFDVAGRMSEAEAARAFKEGRILFAVSIPSDFGRRVLRGERPQILVEADGSDPTAASGALAALAGIMARAQARDFTGPLARLAGGPPPYGIAVHRRYNPEGLTRYNIVPGLMGLILTLMTVMMTALAVTRERERGTMENLLASPLTPLEIMAGKILPYVAIGHIQMGIVLAAALFLFRIPFAGDPLVFYAASVVFMAANLTVGVTVSSIASNQLQALQMTIFYFLPNLMLSGFMFPFAGMPDWAQAIGCVLPLTHFNRIVRGVLLKGSGWPELWPELWPIALFAGVVLVLAVTSFRRTLD
ncbi:MAG: ABC transporter permease [Desulfovibrio sp.]|nr:ABC transporter permease [Desulfovibrio sp.]